LAPPISRSDALGSLIYLSIPVYIAAAGLVGWGIGAALAILYRAAIRQVGRGSSASASARTVLVLGALVIFLLPSATTAATLTLFRRGCLDEASGPAVGAGLPQTGSLMGWIVFQSARNGTGAGEKLRRMLELGTPDASLDIYATSPDGRRQVRLTRDSCPDETPAVSPDGRWVAFSADRFGSYDLFVVRADGSAERRLTAAGVKETCPAWSPDGTGIAFLSQGGAGASIHVIDVDGSSKRQLQILSPINSCPAWSPDGSQITFVSEPFGDPKIRGVSPDGGIERILFHLPFRSYEHVDWSPDGSTLALERAVERHVLGGQAYVSQIYLIEVSSQRVRRVSSIDTNEEAPVWSPDGSKIAFASQRPDDDFNESADVYVMDVRSGLRLGVTTSVGEDRSPNW